MTSLARITETDAPAAVILVRLAVGGVFLSEGIQKFLFPAALGVGRFAKIGIPAPQVMAPFDGVFEIGCGLLLLLGLLTRLAAIPMIINMLVAITTTKIPILLKSGFWSMAHEARVDYTMLLGSIFLLVAGAGPWSLDARLAGGTASGGDRARRLTERAEPSGGALWCGTLPRPVACQPPVEDDFPLSQVAAGEPALPLQPGLPIIQPGERAGRLLP